MKKLLLQDPGLAPRELYSGLRPKPRVHILTLGSRNRQESDRVQCQDIFSAENEKYRTAHHGSGACVHGGHGGGGGPPSRDSCGESTS